MIHAPNATDELDRSFKLQTQAIAHRFKWGDDASLLDKCAEELEEVREALGENNPEHLFEEIGDLLLIASLLATYKGVHPSEALKVANDKFEKRFAFMFKYVTENGESMETASLDKMIKGWKAAKVAGL